MKKNVFMVIMFLFLIIVVTGCGKNGSSSCDFSNCSVEKEEEKNPLIGTWQYVLGNDITTYVFKEDGTLWVDGEYIDKYTDNTAICDNCLTHVGLHEIQFKLKDDLLYINFYKQTYAEPSPSYDRPNEPTVHYLMTLGSYVKASRIN